MERSLFNLGGSSLIDVAGFSVVLADDALRVRKPAVPSLGGIGAVALTALLILAALLTSGMIALSADAASAGSVLRPFLIAVFLLASLPACWGLLVGLEAVGFVDYEARLVERNRTR